MASITPSVGLVPHRTGICPPFESTGSFISITDVANELHCGRFQSNLIECFVGDTYLLPDLFCLSLKRPPLVLVAPTMLLRMAII
jgi:hypothetical protein